MALLFLCSGATSEFGLHIFWLMECSRRGVAVYGQPFIRAALELGIPIKIFLLETGEGVGSGLRRLRSNKDFVRGIWNG